MMFSGANEGLLLISLGIGYIAILSAKKEEKKLRILGYIIGGLIIALSAIALLRSIGMRCQAASMDNRYRSDMMQHRMMPPHIPPQQAPGQR